MQVRVLGSMLLLVLLLASDASAQWLPPPPAPPVPYSRETPEREIGLNLAIWGLGYVGGGGRFTRNVTEWFAYEVSLDGSRAGEYRHAWLFGVANTRFLLRGPDARALFATVGVGSGVGLSHGVSPMIGGGLQRGWDRGKVAFRGELQYFTRGKMSGHQARLLVGIAIALRE